MSIPAYLDSSVYPFSYYETTTLLTDVETGGVGVISQMRSMLVGGSLNWTEPSTALFKTPVDAAGRFLDVLVTRISSTVVEWRVRNAAAATICTRRANLGLGGMRIYASSAHVLVEFLFTDPNGSENLSANVLDMAPDANTDHVLYVIGAGYRNTAGTQDSSGNIPGRYFAINNGSATAVDYGGYYNQSSAANVIEHISPDGRWHFREIKCAISFAGAIRWAGRQTHTLISSTVFNGGNERKIYIDTNTVATYKAIGLALAATNIRQFMRKS